MAWLRSGGSGGEIIIIIIFKNKWEMVKTREKDRAWGVGGGGVVVVVMGWDWSNWNWYTSWWLADILSSPIHTQVHARIYTNACITHTHTHHPSTTTTTSLPSWPCRHQSMQTDLSLSSCAVRAVRVLVGLVSGQEGGPSLDLQHLCLPHAGLSVLVQGTPSAAAAPTAATHTHTKGREGVVSNWISNRLPTATGSLTTRRSNSCHLRKGAFPQNKSHR